MPERAAERTTAGFAAAALPLIDTVHDFAFRLTAEPVAAAWLTEAAFGDAQAAGSGERVELLRVTYGLWRRQLQGRGWSAVQLADDEAKLEPVVALEGGGGDASVSPAALAAATQVAVSRAATRPAGDPVAALPDQHRAVVALVDLHGLSCAEAAAVTSTPPAVVLRRLHQARAALLPGQGCAELGERRTAYSIGELAAPEVAVVRAHSSGCGACAGALVAERELVATLRRSLTAAPAPVATLVRARLAGARPAKLRRRRWRWRWPVAAATVLVALVLGTVLLARPIADEDPARPAAGSVAGEAAAVGAAWDLFAAARLPLGPRSRAALTPLANRAELLVPLELYLNDAGTVGLAGREAVAIDYQGRAGRLVVFRWPVTGGAPPAAAALASRPTRWGLASARWWADRGVATLVIGATGPSAFKGAVDRVRRAGS